jgi:hypothetical protein
MEYFFRCNGNFIIHMKKILHEIDSIWKNYYIIKFPNKYYAGTNISSQYYYLGVINYLLKLTVTFFHVLKNIINKFYRNGKRRETK